MKKKHLCLICKTQHSRTAPLCQRCYQYNRRHPEGRYPIPPSHEIHITQNGDIVCHECGEAHSKLIQHVYYAHHISKNEYCDRHGFLHNQRFTNQSYHEKMQRYTKKYYSLVVKENLVNHGQHTRYQPNQTIPGRGGKGKKKGVIYKEVII